MPDNEELTYSSKETSTGHSLAEGKYLDTHYECMRFEYETMLKDAGIQLGWSVLDAGAGGGSFLPLMSQLVGSAGHIDALDLAPENIEMIDEQSRAGRYASSVVAKAGSILNLPYENEQFDLIWSANVTQYLTDEELSQTIKEFRRVTRSGGLVVIKEVDMDACRQVAPFPPLMFKRILEAVSGMTQVAGVLRTTMLPFWLRKAGLVDVTYKTYLGERMHPLDKQTRSFIEGLLAFWGNAAIQLDLPEQDLIQWRRTLDKDSPDYILNDPNFYWREVWGLVKGRVP
ncbi:MAG: methyltransferase domain-containing protein [Chloroflexota bacterium]